jgi:hypothetical protein
MDESERLYPKLTPEELDAACKEVRELDDMGFLHRVKQEPQPGESLPVEVRPKDVEQN